MVVCGSGSKGREAEKRVFFSFSMPTPFFVLADVSIKIETAKKITKNFQGVKKNGKREKKRRRRFDIGT